MTPDGPSVHNGPLLLGAGEQVLRVQPSRSSSGVDGYLIAIPPVTNGAHVHFCIYETTQARHEENVNVGVLLISPRAHVHPVNVLFF